MGPSPARRPARRRASGRRARRGPAPTSWKQVVCYVLDGWGPTCRAALLLAVVLLAVVVAMGVVVNLTGSVAWGGAAGLVPLAVLAARSWSHHRHRPTPRDAPAAKK